MKYPNFILVIFKRILAIVTPVIFVIFVAIYTVVMGVANLFKYLCSLDK